MSAVHSPDKRIKVPLCMGAAVCAVILSVLVLKPAYDRYIAADHAQTCEKSRFVILDHYNHAVEKLRDAGTPMDEIDCKKELQQVLDDLKESFPEMTVESAAAQGEKTGRGAETDAAAATAEAVYEIRGLCRSGGTDTITMDPATHKLNTVCSIHGEYNLGFENFR